MLWNLLARSRLFTDQLIRCTRLLLSPPTSPALAFADVSPSSSASVETQSWLPDMSILLTQKHRATIERRLHRRHSELPMSLMVKYGTPRRDLHQCLECGTWHERKTICGQCYDRIRQETQAMKDAFPNQDELKYNYPPQEITYVRRICWNRDSSFSRKDSPTAGASYSRWWSQVELDELYQMHFRSPR